MDCPKLAEPGSSEELHQRGMDMWNYLNETNLDTITKTSSIHSQLEERTNCILSPSKRPDLLLREVQKNCLVKTTSEGQTTSLYIVSTSYASVWTMKSVRNQQNIEVGLLRDLLASELQQLHEGQGLFSQKPQDHISRQHVPARK